MRKVEEAEEMIGDEGLIGFVGTHDVRRVEDRGVYVARIDERAVFTFVDDVEARAIPDVQFVANAEAEKKHGEEN